MIEPIKYTYESPDGQWSIEILDDSKVRIQLGEELRDYNTKRPITKVEQKNEYVYITVKGGNQYIFKFEESSFLVGDIYDENDEFVDSFACHVFNEEEFEGIDPF